VTGRILLLVGVALATAAAKEPELESPNAPDTTRSRTSEIVDSVSLLPRRSPGTAVLLSLLVPGGGQVYTGHYWKAPLIAAAEVGLGALAWREHRFCVRALELGDTVTYRLYRDRRTAFLWWMAGATVFSMADAYVSARLYAFDRQMRLSLGPCHLGVVIALADCRFP